MDKIRVGIICDSFCFDKDFSQKHHFPTFVQKYSHYVYSPEASYPYLRHRMSLNRF